MNAGLDAQVADPYTLHTGREIGWDVIRLVFSNPSNIGNRTLAFDRLEFRDSTNNVLSQLDFGVRGDRRYLGQYGDPGGAGTGWLSDEFNGLYDFVWAQGLEAYLHYPIPANTAQLVFRVTLPAVNVTTQLFINGNPAGSMFHDASDPINPVQVFELPLTGHADVLSFSAPAGGAFVRLRSWQFVNPQNQVTGSAGGLDLAPGVNLAVNHGATPCDLIVTAEVSGAQPGDRLLVYLNRAGNENLILDRPLLNGTNTYTSAEPDALRRQGDYRTPGLETRHWAEDCRRTVPVNRGPQTSVAFDNGLLRLSAPAGFAVEATIDANRNLRLGAGGARYLNLRVRAAANTLYFIRLFYAPNLYHQRAISALENRRGTGDWEQLVFDLEHFFKYQFPPTYDLTALSFVAIGAAPGQAPLLDVDYFRFGAAPAANPPDVTADEVFFDGEQLTLLIDGLDNDLDGLADYSDAQVLAHLPRQVLAWYHTFFGSPDGAVGDWLAFYQPQMMQGGGGEVPTGYVFDPDVCIGSGLTLRRNICSIYWPLNFNVVTGFNREYVPPLEEDQINHADPQGLDYLTNTFNCSSVWQYDALTPAWQYNQIRTAADYAIDGFVMQLAGFNQDLFLHQWMKNMLEQTVQANLDDFSDFGCAAFYYHYTQPQLRSVDEIARDVWFMNREYLGHPGALRPYRRLFGEPAPQSTYWRRGLLTAPLESGALTAQQWGTVLDKAQCPPSIAFDGEIALPFTPDGSRVDFQLECLNPAPNGGGSTGFFVDRLQTLDVDGLPLPNAAGATRDIDVGGPGDSTALQCRHQCSNPQPWRDPVNSYSPLKGDFTYRSTSSQNGQPNSAYFSLHLDAPASAQAARMLLFDLRSQAASSGAVLRYWNEGANQYVELARWGAGGAFPAINSTWRIYIYRLRYPGDPANPAELCDSPLPLNFDFLSDELEYANGPFNGYAFFNRAFIDRGTLINVPQPNLSATMQPGFFNSRLIQPEFTAERRNGDFYREQWDKALLCNPSYVFINGWNEWNENAMIEPTVEYGFKYLEITLTYALIYKGLLETVFLPSASRLQFKRCDPLEYVTSVAHARTRVIEFETPTAETLVFRGVFPYNTPTSFRLLRNGAPAQALAGRSLYDLSIQTVASPFRERYRLEIFYDVNGEGVIQCNYQLSGDRVFFPAGGEGALSVQAASNLCEWEALSDSNWLTITGGSPDNGSGVIRFSVQPSTADLSRFAIITIDDAQFEVAQQGNLIHRIQRHLVGQQPIAPGELTTYDVNSDGLITIADITYVKSVLEGRSGP